MSTGLNANNSTIVSAFHAELVHQALVALLILLLLGLAWNLLRGHQLRRSQEGAAGGRAVALGPEPVARRLLRIAFGLLWIFDGLLQAQSSMPLGMAPQVIRPAAASSPTWVQHLLNWLATSWSYHPITAPAAVVWIQVGIGAWLLAAPRGRWSRAGGVVSVGWALIVWVFGEAFGGIFAPGLTWLFGAPGAVAFYCAAGLLVALPERQWSSPRLGRIILRAMGLFFVGMAILQAWPGRGFWQGRIGTNPQGGTLAGMVGQMAQTPQPHLLASWVSAFGAFDAAHGWAVNLFVVIALTGIGIAFLSVRPRLVFAGVVAGLVLCVADWVLIEDFGFFGGVGTDPNSALPMALLFVGGYLALTRPSEPAGVVVPLPTPQASGWRARLDTNPTYTLRALAALGAVGLLLIGIVPAAFDSLSAGADPILAQASGGSPQATDFRAPGFQLIDQQGAPVSLAGLRGKAVALTFLDPVCTSTCPLIAQYFRQADQMLGSSADRVQLVAIDANPRYISTSYLNAFDQQEQLGQVHNWTYLTGSLSQLERVWNSYGIMASPEPAGAMIAHSEVAYLISPSGRVRYTFGADPGPATEATQSSYSVLLAGDLRSTLGT